MGLAKPSETRGLMSTGPDLAFQEFVGWVFRWVWNQRNLFLRSKPAPLVGYPDPLLRVLRRAFWPAFQETGIPDDWYRSTIGVIVISLRTPQSARVNIGCTCHHLEVSTTSLGVPATTLGALTSNLGVPTTSLWAAWSASNKGLWEKLHFLWERCGWVLNS